MTRPRPPAWSPERPTWPCSPSRRPRAAERGHAAWAWRPGPTPFMWRVPTRWMRSRPSSRKASRSAVTMRRRPSSRGARDPRLEDLAREFLDMSLISTEQLLGTGRSARKPADVPVEEAAEFAARRAEAILNLRPRLEAEMRNLGVDYLFHEIE